VLRLEADRGAVHHKGHDTSVLVDIDKKHELVGVALWVRVRNAISIASKCKTHQDILKGDAPLLVDLCIIVPVSLDPCHVLSIP